jgi:hypothetical protein
VLQSADALNQLLMEHDLSSEAAADSTLRTLLHGRRNRGAHVHENFSPSHFLYLRQLSSSRILQALAAERAVPAAAEVTRSIVVGIDRKLLELASEEVSWLTVPEEPSKLEAPQVLQLQQSKGKSKKSKEDKPHFAAVEELVSAEEVFLKGLFHVFAQVRPSIVVCLVYN